jgi:cysteine desulfurase
LLNDDGVPRQIYLDFNASTPIAQEVRAAMLPFLEEAFGNPSSLHWAGSPVRQATERAREQLARFFACAAREVIFTSGGSESNNTAIKGAVWAAGIEGAHLITSAIEHPATLEVCRFLSRHGAQVTVLPVDGFGRLDPDDVRRAITPRTVLITLMHANNEVGTIQPIREVADIARQRGVLLHVDAAQSAGKIPVRADELGADLISLAGHKLYAPKGVGALYLRSGVRIEPLIHGGGHEGGRRAGTESALLWVGLGAAAELAERWLPRSGEVQALRDALHAGLAAAVGGALALNGHPVERLPNTLNVSFLGRSGAEVLAALPGVAASTGSACHEGQSAISPVLRAMGASEAAGRGAVRFSLGRSTSSDEIEETVGAVARL